jgi:hypothetical protein
LGIINEQLGKFLKGFIIDLPGLFPKLMSSCRIIGIGRNDGFIVRNLIAETASSASSKSRAV